MASASDYLETRILDFFLKNNSLSTSAPNPIYVALFTGDPTDSAGLTDFANEVSTSGSSNYARTQVSFGTIDTQAGSVSNSGAVTFPVAGANYNGTVTHVAIVDNATAGQGNILFHGALSDDKTVETNDTFQINTGQLTVTIA
tara:strand:+ start:675 stop:1103 length:429 start_codon:yes stop_codon:yes gene_type:complete